MYLITAKYTSDSERKRIEYALEKWRDRMKITKPEGLVAIVDDGEIDELVVELYSRTEKDNVSIYRIQEAHFDVAEAEKEIRIRLNENRETAEKLLDFIMARQKAVLKSRMAGAKRKIYEVITRKGKAEISLSIIPDQDGIDAVCRISGYGETVDFLYGKLVEEFKLLEGR
jgi:hypothetical protein